MTTTRRSARRVWLGAWVVGAGIGVANGVLREATFAKRLDERRAHQVSCATGVLAFAALFRGLERRRPIPSDREALGIGAAWLVMTVLFEFAFGRLVARKSWRELLADYDVVRGRLWPVVLAWLAVGPLVARRLDRSGRPVT